MLCCQVAVRYFTVSHNICRLRISLRCTCRNRCLRYRWCLGCNRLLRGCRCLRRSRFLGCFCSRFLLLNGNFSLQYFFDCLFAFFVLNSCRYCCLAGFHALNLTGLTYLCNLFVLRFPCYFCLLWFVFDGYFLRRTYLNNNRLAAKLWCFRLCLCRRCDRRHAVKR